MAPTEFPPVRACLFDMDGLLIDTEDLYTTVTNTLLAQCGRPPLTWHIKAQLQGRPVSAVRPLTSLSVTLILQFPGHQNLPRLGATPDPFGRIS
jgi:hypothetical protein